MPDQPDIPPVAGGPPPKADAAPDVVARTRELLSVASASGAPVAADGVSPQGVRVALSCPPDVFAPLWNKVQLMIDAVEAAPEDPEKIGRASEVLQEVMKVVPGSELILEHLSESRRTVDVGLTSIYTKTGTVLYADVAGFTAQVEQATRERGDAGKVRAAINTTFAEFDAVVRARGGTVLKLGGDSMTIIIRGSHSMERAGQVADELLRIARDTGRITIKVGGSYGEVQMAILSDAVRPGDTKQRSLFVSGDAYHDALDAEAHTAHGERKIRGEEWARFLAEDDPGIFNFKAEVARLLVASNAVTPEQQRAVLIEAISTLLTFTPRGTSDRLLAGMRHGGRHISEVSGFTRHATLFIAMPDRDLLDPGWQRYLRAFYIRASQEVARTGGAINKTDGSKIIVTFKGLSGRDGDCEERAYRCACAIMEKEGVAMGLKMGIASGLTISGKMGAIDSEGKPQGTYEHTILGSSVNMSARLMTATDSGTILVSESVREKCHSLAQHEAPTTKALKGIGEAVPCTVVEGIKRRYGMGLDELRVEDSALLERDADLTRAIGMIGQAFHEQRYRHLAIKGDMGSGKTAFANALLARVGQGAAESAPAIHAIKNQPHQAPFSTCGELVKVLLNSDPERSPDHQCREMKARLDSLSIGDPMRSALLSLAGLTEDSYELTTIQSAMLLLVRKVAQSTPHLVFIKDMQWCDEDSRLVFDFVNRNLKDEKIPLVFLSTQRQGQRAGEAAKEESFVIPPLTRASVAAYICHLLKGEREEVVGDRTSEVPDSLVKVVWEMSEGNPLAIREVVALLIRDGTLLPGSPDLLQKPLPADLGGRTAMTELIWSNIDRLIEQRALSNEARGILVLLSVLGSPSPRFFIEALYEGDSASLERNLTDLEMMGFVTVSSGEIRFKSVLMGEAINRGTLGQDANPQLRRAIGILEGAGGAVATYRAQNSLQYEDALFRYALRLEENEKVLQYGNNLLRLTKGSPSLRRRAIAYAEKTLEAAQRLNRPLEIRARLADLGKLRTEIASRHDLEGAVKCFDQALDFLHDPSLESETEHFFARLELLRGKTEAIIMRAGKDPTPFETLAKEQRTMLDRLKQFGQDAGPRYIIHFFNFQDSAIIAFLYRAIQIMQKNPEQAEVILRQAQQRCEELLASGGIREYPHFILFFQFLRGRILEERYKLKRAKNSMIDTGIGLNARMIRSLTGAVTFYRENAGMITGSSNLHRVSNLLIACGEGYRLRALHHHLFTFAIRADRERAQGYYEAGLEIAQKAGSATHECFMFENLANEAQRAIERNLGKRMQVEQLKEDCDACIRWSSLGYRLSKEHQLTRHTAYAAANLAYAYYYSGQREKGQRYYNEVVALAQDPTVDVSVREDLSDCLQKELAPYKSN